MNYVVTCCTLRNLKSVDIGAFSFDNLVQSKHIVYLGLGVSSFNLKVRSINQNTIVDVEVSGYCKMKDSLRIVDVFEDVVDIVVQ